MSAATASSVVNSPTASYRVIVPRPHPGQQVVLDALARSDVRFAWLDAGRRWFKTTLEMIWALDGALRGEEVLWGAPVYDQARTGMEYTRRACAGHPHIRFLETRMEASFPGGGVIRWRSLDNPDNARSKTASRAIIDEAADVPALAWFEVIRPILMSTDGKALIAGTPDGRNWFYRELIKALAGENPHHVAWQVPTVGARVSEDGQLLREPHPMENPHIRWAEIEEMFRTMPIRAFRQEVLGEFLDDAGGVFHGVRACLRPYQFLERHPQPGAGHLAIGLDLAKFQDYTVLLVMDLAARRVVGFERWNQDSWPLQKARIVTLARGWGTPTLYMDATGLGDPIYDDLARAGLPVEPIRFTPATKTALIENAVLQVEQQAVTIPDPAHEPRATVLVAELEAYAYARTPGGRLTMSAPEGLHDDCVTAFALSCWPLAGMASSGIPKEALDMMIEPISEIHGGDFLSRKL